MARVIATETVPAEPGSPCRTEAQMTALCCEPKPELPCCEKVVGEIGPDMDKALENLGLELDAHGRDQNGRLVGIAWKARKNPCGKIVQRYDLTGKNCCDEVEPLEFDTANSVSVLAPGTSGIVRFTGGKLPALVKLRGNGFTLDGYSLRDAWVASRAFVVYAHDFACGFAPITLDDGCTTAKGGLRSTAGGWYLIGSATNFNSFGTKEDFGLYHCTDNLLSSYQSHYDIDLGGRAMIWGGYNRPPSAEPQTVQYYQLAGGCGPNVGQYIYAPHPADPSFTVPVLWRAQSGDGVVQYWALWASTRVFEYRC